MEKRITASMVAQALESVLPRIAYELPKDVVNGLMEACSKETHERGGLVLEHLVKNVDIACSDQVPLCQDTGTVWVSLELGPDVSIQGNVFSQVNDVVAQAYTLGLLRKSVVEDALFDRTNTNDNTPAFCEVHLIDEPGAARLQVMLKGGGSDNASRVVMLPPSAGKNGIADEIIDCVKEKGPNACPPLIIGVGIGATFDKVAGLAKQALMRPINHKAQGPCQEQFEAELLDRINKTGVGPGGMGGNQTALAVHVKTAPCHIAALPLAINMGCSAMRRATVEL